MKEKTSPAIVYFGTPDFAVAPLQKLIAHNKNVVAVVTAPDKPSGRGYKMQASPVKKFALQHHLPVLQPTNLKAEEFTHQLKQLNADLFIVVAFRMLPEQVWKMPPLGTFNLHASLLPQYRGAAPINWAIINGETETGVTTFFIQQEIDTGNIIMQRKVPVSETDTAGTLHDKLMQAGADLVLETVDKIAQGTVTTISQDTLIDKDTVLKPAPKIYRETCRIDWSKSVDEVYNFIRGLSPYPAAHTELEIGGEKFRLKVYQAEKNYETPDVAPGNVKTDFKTYLKVAVKDGYLQLKEVQLTGKRKQSVQEFLNGIYNKVKKHIL